MTDILAAGYISSIVFRLENERSNRIGRGRLAFDSSSAFTYPDDLKPMFQVYERDEQGDQQKTLGGIEGRGT